MCPWHASLSSDLKDLLSLSWLTCIVDRFVVHLQESLFDLFGSNMAHHYLVARQFGGPPGPPRSSEYLVENYAPRLLAVEGSLFALSMSVILMRFYVRIFMLKMFGWDGK
jgi:hypothetical protein